jgi:hypothetical protein
LSKAGPPTEDPRAWAIRCWPVLGSFFSSKPYTFIRFGAMDVTKPYKFIGFGAMDGSPSTV